MFFNRKKNNNKVMKSDNNTLSEKEFREIQCKLAHAVKIAIGKNFIDDFIANCKLTDPQLILNILKGNYKEFPDRQLLRLIASNSNGRITHQHLYFLCGYSEQDPEEDRSWTKWVPQWGDVYMCDLGVGEDSLQGGKRPVCIIQNNKGNQHSPNVCIVPISSKSKFKSFLHILLEKELGFEKDSFAYAEMPMTISKRRFFYSTIPYKITTLPENKMKEIQFGLEKQFGFSPLMFDEEHAFELAKSIKLLQENIRIKKSNNLIDLLNEKINELMEYCFKYKKSYDYIMKEYDRINNYAYQVI